MNEAAATNYCEVLNLNLEVGKPLESWLMKSVAMVHCLETWITC